MTDTLAARIERQLAAPVNPHIAEGAKRLAEESGAVAALFYGSNLRTGSLEGVLDFYLLLPGDQQERIWPRISYHEWAASDGTPLRAKVATMALAHFHKACTGQLRDTTIWARFVQPSALVWAAWPVWQGKVVAALSEAAQTAARLAVALGPPEGAAEDYWKALFQATYQAEFRVEKRGREDSILAVNKAHFDGLLPLALDAGDMAFKETPAGLAPEVSEEERRATLRWWRSRRRWGKPLNITRLIKASTTFDGAARYAAWKIERHTGVAIEVTPWREKHPLLAAPGVLWKLWRARAKG